MKILSFISIFTIFVFTGCVNNSMLSKGDTQNEKCACSVEDIKTGLSQDKRRLLYKEIKNEIQYLFDDADTYYANTYYLKALQTYELINFYNDKELISAKKIQRLQTRISANGQYYYDKAINTTDDNLKKLFYLNELLRNDPNYKDGKKLHTSLKNDPKIVSFLNQYKKNLEEMLKNRSNEKEYLLKLDKATQKLAKYDDFDPLVAKAKNLLKRKRYLLQDEAIALYKNNQFKEAKEQFDFIIKMYKKDRTSQNYLRKMQRQHELKSLEKEAKLALASSDYKKALTLSSEILAFNDNNSEALNIMKKANSELKREIPKMINQAKQYYGAQEYKKALSIFKEILSLDSANNTAMTYTKKIKAQLRTIESLK